MDEIKSLIKYLENKDKFIYHLDAFEGIFSGYNIHHNKINKIKLIEAGLIQTDEIAIHRAHRKRAKYWVRGGTVILRNKNNTKCINDVPLSK